MNRLAALEEGEFDDVGTVPKRKKPGGKRKAGGKRARAAAAAAAAEFSETEEMPDVKATNYSVPEVAAASTPFSPSDTAYVSIEPPTESVEPVNFEEFTRQTNEVQTNTDLITEKVLEYSQLTREKLRVSDAKKRREMNVRLDEISKQIDDAIKGTKTTLEQMKVDTDALPRDHVGIIKMRENQHSYLSRQFIECVQGFSKAQQESQDLMQDETERRVRQRLSAQGEVASEEDVKKIAMQVMQGQENALFSSAKDELAMVQQNARDMQKIYDAMVGLEQLFRDFDVLVNEQGEVLDQIISNVQKAENYVGKGMKNLTQAKKYQKKSRKKMCGLLFVVALVFCIILAVVLGFSLPKF